MCIFHKTKMKYVQGGFFILILMNLCTGYTTGEMLQENNYVPLRMHNLIKDNEPSLASVNDKMHERQKTVSTKAKLQQFSKIKLNQLTQTQIQQASHAFEAVGNMPRSYKQKNMDLSKNFSLAFKDDITLNMARNVKSVLKFLEHQFQTKKKTFAFDPQYRSADRTHGRGILSDDSVNLNEDDYIYYYFDGDSTNDRIKGKESKKRANDAHILKENTNISAQASQEYVDKLMDYVADSSSSNIIAEDYLNDDFYNYVEDQPYADENVEHASLTEQKWRDLGTPEAVEKTRRRHLTAEDSVKAHITRVHYQAECRLPKPKIIQVTDASKRFVPHCTVLHRCEDDTGCCHSDTQTCYPKFTQKVNLHFYVIQVGVDQPQIETLLFDNHTECQCIERNRLQQQISRPTKTSEVEGAYRCRCPNHFEIFEEDDEEDVLSISINISKTCRCDCVSDNRNCEQLKRGMEAFTVEDRRCISDRRCNSPTCEYGTYNRRKGRCPKMQDKLETARRLSLDHN